MLADTDPMFLPCPLTFEMAAWRRATAFRFETTAEDILEGCLQYMRYLLSRPSQGCATFEEELYNRATRSNRLDYRLGLISAQIDELTVKIKGQIGHLKEQAPSVVNRLRPMVIDSSIFKREEMAIPPPDDEETAWINEMLSSKTAGQDLHQYVAADLAAFVVTTAQAWSLSPEAVIREAVWISAWVMANSGGLGGNNFREELFVRQSEVDSVMLQLDQFVSDLESHVPQAEALAAHLTEKSESIVAVFHQMHSHPVSKKD